MKKYLLITFTLILFSCSQNENSNLVSENKSALPNEDNVAKKSDELDDEIPF